MTRVLIGVVMAWAMTVAPALAGVSEPTVKTLRDGNRATITLRAGGLTVTQILTQSVVDIQLGEGHDTLRVTGDLEGRVIVERRGQRHTFSMRAAQAADQVALNAMLSGSPALSAFDRVLQSSWGQSHRAAAMFKSSRELIRVLQGDYRSVTSLAAPPVASTALVRVAQRLSPSQCWDTYARDVIHFTYELQSCLNSASYQWWNPLATGWCAYEYNLKSSLAGIWLLDCYGVPV